MRAVRLSAARALEVVDVPEPVAAAGDAVVRVGACGICGSDLSCYKTGVFAGAVLGHEIAGTVEQIDGTVSDLAAGDLVVVDPKTPCGACDECVAGAYHRCIAALTTGIGQVERGGFAERLAVATTQLHRVPAGLDLETASLAEPLAVALHGLHRAGARAEPAVVLGLGSLGLLTVAVLRDIGASPIVGVDPVAVRRDLALAHGADAAVAPEDPAARDAHPSLVVDTSGHPSAIAEAGNIARPGARVLLLGIPMGDVSVWPMVLVTKELDLIGSIAQTDHDFRLALELLARTPAIGSIITERVGLDGVPAAFERLTVAPDGGKVTVVPT